jgi:antitoxin HicB
MTEDTYERLEQVEAEIRESINHQSLVDHYMKLAYRVVCVKDGEQYVVSHPELSGCYSVGDTLEQALAGLHDVKALWIEGRLAAGMAVPEPK